MRYLVYGAGAIGGVIGGHLYRAGRDVTLLARGAHLAALQADGLRLDTADGVLTLPMPAIGSAAAYHWSEDTVVVLSVKSQQTAAALADLLAHAPERTAIVSAQNGVTNEREILRRFPATYAMCVMLPATHLEPGHVVQHSAGMHGLLDVGAYPAGVDAVAEAVVADLRAAGFSSEARAEVMAWKYRKLISNLGNGVDAIAVADDAADELVLRAQAEGEAVLAAAGIPVITAEQDRVRRGDLMQPFRTDVARGGGSTWQSVTRGSDVEVDYLTGEIVLLGRLHGVPTPVNALIQRTVHDLVRAGGAARSLPAGDLLDRLPHT